jgi:hypothetical protein
LPQAAWHKSGGQATSDGGKCRFVVSCANNYTCLCKREKAAAALFTVSVCASSLGIFASSLCVRVFLLLLLRTSLAPFSLSLSGRDILKAILALHYYLHEWCGQ